MRTDVLDIQAYYASPLGEASQRYIAQRLSDAWGDATGHCVAGFGYTQPYLPVFREAERCINLAPEAMGAIKPRTGGAMSSVALTSDIHWPLADASIDRILLIHGLEETATPHKLMREIWRVLADDGKLIIAVPNRRGPWAMVESTPFAAGRPYLRGQLAKLLKESMFTPTAWSSALYFPPIKQNFLIKGSRAWEQAGARLWPGFAGITLVEAQKEIILPVTGHKVEVLKPRLLKPVRGGLAGRTTNDHVKQIS